MVQPEVDGHGDAEVKKVRDLRVDEGLRVKVVQQQQHALEKAEVLMALDEDEVGEQGNGGFGERFLARGIVMGGGCHDGEEEKRFLVSQLRRADCLGYLDIGCQSRLMLPKVRQEVIGLVNADAKAMGVY